MKRGRKRKDETEGPNPVDIFVGSKVRFRRTLLNMSQEKLATAMGLTFQQVQKYERGLNRISASRLWEIANILKTPISFFFDGAAGDGKKAMRVAEKHNEIEYDPMQRKETVDLIRLYYQIEDPKVAKKVFDLIKSLAKNDPDAN